MTIIIIIAIIALLVLWVISVQRKLVNKDELCQNAMSTIGVQQESRWDALTGMVELIKSYNEHEYNTLRDTIAQRRPIDSNSTAEQVDAQDAKAIRAALKRATKATDKLSVIIFKAPCRLIDRSRGKMPVIHDCRRCGTCIQIGCPALGRDETGYAVIDPNQCIGCNQCVQSCPFGCIEQE